MKEKTLEELIVNIIDDEGNIRASDVHELLQQVREATIAECKEVLKDYNDGFGFEMLERNSLPTDRIKLTENK